MDANTLIQVIVNQGVAIGVALAMGFFIYKAYNDIMTRGKEREQQLYETILNCQAELKKSSETNASFIEILQQMRTELNLIHEDIDKIKGE